MAHRCYFQVINRSIQRKIKSPVPTLYRHPICGGNGAEFYTAEFLFWLWL